MGGLLLWYSEEGTERSRSPPRPLIVVPNITARPTTASVPITVLLYNVYNMYEYQRIVTFFDYCAS